MNNRDYIRTNRVTVKLDRVNIDQNFDVFAINAESTEKGLAYKVLDNEYKACAVYYSGSGSFCYVMFEKNKVNLWGLREEVEKIDKNCVTKKIDVKDSSLSDRDLANLLLNSLKSDTDEEFGYNNLTGSLLYIVDRGKSRKKPSEVVTLKMNIDNRWCIFPTVQTYCRYSMEEIAKLNQEGKGQKNRKVPFVIDKDGLFHKITKDTKSKVLYLKKKRNPDSKNVVDYIVWRNFEAFRKTKMGALYQLMTDVEKYLSQYISLSFERREIERDFIDKRKTDVDLKKIAKKYDKECKVVDLTGESATIVEKIKKNYYKVTGQDIAESSDVQKNCVNFVIVKEKIEYAKAKEQDQYIRNAKGTVIQHITTKDLGSTEKLELAWMKVLVKETLIKQDLQNGKIEIEDWRQYGWQNMISFAVREIMDSKKKVYVYKVMKVYPDGTFAIDRFAFPDSSVKTNLREEEQAALVSVWQEEGVASEIEMAIYEDIDHIYVIRRTSEHPILNVKVIGDHLRTYQESNEVDKNSVTAALDDYEAPDEWKDNIKMKLNENVVIINKELAKLINLRTDIGQGFNYHMATIYDVIVSPQVKSPVFDGLYEMGNMIGITLIKEKDVVEGGTPCYTYVVGKKNQGKIQFSLDKGCVIRQIYCAKNKPLDKTFVERIINMVQVEWVTIDQYTVLPMVNKYLREG